MQSRPPLPPRGQPPQEEEEYAPPSGPPPGFHQRQQQNTSSTAGAPPGFPPVPNEPPPAPSAWNEHFFYSNGRPTPVFEALMKEFWKRLDPRGTGYIAPEVFSGFMEINHFAPDDDVCMFIFSHNIATLIQCALISHLILTCGRFREAESSRQSDILRRRRG